MHECNSRHLIGLKFLVSHVASVAILRLDDDERIMAYNLKTIHTYGSISNPELCIFHSIVYADVSTDEQRNVLFKNVSK